MFQGVLEAIRISCAGYPTKRTFEEFLDRFGMLAPDVLDGYKLFLSLLWHSHLKGIENSVKNYESKMKCNHVQLNYLKHHLNIIHKNNLLCACILHHRESIQDHLKINIINLSLIFKSNKIYVKLHTPI